MLSDTRLVYVTIIHILIAFLICISMCKDVTLCLNGRAAKVSFQVSAQVPLSCDSPGARGAEGHLSWL